MNKKNWHGAEVLNESWFPTINYDKCNNCGMCLLACGNKVFLWSNKENRYIVGNPSNCVLGCTTCSKLCPTDAITFPEEPKKFITSLLMKYKIYPKVKDELNVRLEKFKDHNVSINNTTVSKDPKDEFSNWYGIKRAEIHWYPDINIDKCTGCGLCVVTCSEKRNVFGYDKEKKKAFVLFPYNCMVGCNNCQVSCMWNAISFPDFAEVKKLSMYVLENNRELIIKEIFEKIKQQDLQC
jgi:NAD-dependent dihydropyrimidine dehydrogenase PreA subunit